MILLDIRHVLVFLLRFVSLKLFVQVNSLPMNEIQIYYEFVTLSWEKWAVPRDASVGGLYINPTAYLRISIVSSITDTVVSPPFQSPEIT